MLHRIKKENDLNKDKWIGVGGKFIDKESPEECAVREVKEETGLTLDSYEYRGDRHVRLQSVGNGVYAPLHFEKFSRNAHRVRRGRSGMGS